MKFTLTSKAVDHINKYHVYFAEKATKDPGNAFDTLLDIEAHFQSTPAVKGCTVPAVLFDGTKTEIYIEWSSENGWRFIERPAHNN